MSKTALTTAPYRTDTGSSPDAWPPMSSSLWTVCVMCELAALGKGTSPDEKPAAVEVVADSTRQQNWADCKDR